MSEMLLAIAPHLGQFAALAAQPATMHGKESDQQKMLIGTYTGHVDVWGMRSPARCQAEDSRPTTQENQPSSGCILHRLIAFLPGALAGGKQAGEQDFSAGHGGGSVML